MQYVKYYRNNHDCWILRRISLPLIDSITV